MGGAGRAVRRAAGGVTSSIKSAARGDIKGVIKGAANSGRGFNDPLGLFDKQPGAQVPGIETMESIEAKYGIARPKYESLRGPDGQLRSEFVYDPTKSAAFQKLQQQAMAQAGESPWAKMQLEKQALEQSGARDAAAKAALQGVAQQQSSLARMGGLSGGARERLARSGVQTTARAQQDVARQGMLDRLGVTEQDIARQQQALGIVGKEELGGQAANLQSMMGDVTGKQAFDIAKYREQMQSLGAQKTAQGQVQAANASRKK